MRLRMGRTAVVIVMSLLGVAAPAAAAEPPLNDTLLTATAIALPYAGSQDTRSATTEPDVGCGGSNSVWYRFTTPAQTGSFVVGTAGSDYPVSLGLFTGDLTVGCRPDSLTYQPTPGTTYFIEVGDRSEAGGGGRLELQVQWLPPPANDTEPQATPILALPFSSGWIDARSAHDDALPCPEEYPGDRAWNGVWYTFTPRTDVRAVIAAESIPSAELNISVVAAPAEGGCSLTTTGDYGGVFRSGVEYTILMGLDWPLWSGELLQYRMQMVEHPLAVDGLTIDRKIRVNERGQAVVSGSAACRSGGDWSFGVNTVTLLQNQAKRSQVVAQGAIPAAQIQCDGKPRSWTVTLAPAPGPGFKPGRATATAVLSLEDRLGQSDAAASTGQVTVAKAK